MSNGINSYGNGNNNIYNSDLQTINKRNAYLSCVDNLWTTKLREEERTTFTDTFESTKVDDFIDTDGEKFLDSLKTYKEDIMRKLNITKEQYDNLAVIALALASQETGMGYEAGYNEENTGGNEFFRGVAKIIDSIRGGGSASAGLTQMKIYDFMNSNKLSDTEKELLKDYGINTSNAGYDNLYEEPDKAALATMVVLNSIYNKYGNYTNKLKDEHKNLEVKNNWNTSEQKQLAKQRGEQILNNIINIYNNMSNDSAKSQFRETFKSWLLAQNNSKLGDKTDKGYNEEENLNEFNKILSVYARVFKLSSTDLDYIRYVLTDENAAMTDKEYCAYAWNKGTDGTGMQLDRMLAEKVGTILKNPEDLDYDQFTVNVVSLADKYSK